MIKVHRCEVQWIDFPSGEAHCRVAPDFGANHITVEFTYGDWGLAHNAREMSHDIVRLMLVCDAIKRAGCTIYNIIFDYLPFARQDRIAVDGDAFSLKVFADMVNSIDAEMVTLVDPHSDVAAALFDRCQVIPQHILLRPYFDLRGPDPFVLVAPDAGALKKLWRLAESVAADGVLVGTKQRDPVTGQISATHVHNATGIPLTAALDFVIVDDICDGGRTFIHLAQAIKDGPANGRDAKVVLLVSHGLFTHGLDGIKQYIDEIWIREKRIA